MLLKRKRRYELLIWSLPSICTYRDEEKDLVDEDHDSEGEENESSSDESEDEEPKIKDVLSHLSQEGFGKECFWIAA